MPNDCMECRLCFNGKDNMYCLAFVPERLILYRNDIDYKPMYCPLRPMPKKMAEKPVESENDIWNNLMTFGWNKCIDTIEGDEES